LDNPNHTDYWQTAFNDLAQKVRVMMDIEERFSKCSDKNKLFFKRSAARKAVNEIVNPVKVVPKSTMELWGL